jgi:hypothetical protein
MIAAIVAIASPIFVRRSAASRPRSKRSVMSEVLYEIAYILSALRNRLFTSTTSLPFERESQIAEDKCGTVSAGVLF